MIDFQLQDYWTLVSGHRKNSQGALAALRLMSLGTNRIGRLAKMYVSKQESLDETGFT